MKKRYYTLLLTGLFIPITTILIRTIFHIYGSMYFFLIAALAYAIALMWQDRKNPAHSAMTIISISINIGISLCLLTSILSTHIPSALGFALSPFNMYLMWLSDNSSVDVTLSTYAEVIVMNATLYSIYGGMFYCLKKAMHKHTMTAIC